MLKMSVSEEMADDRILDVLEGTPSWGGRPFPESSAQTWLVELP